MRSVSGFAPTPIELHLDPNPGQAYGQDGRKRAEMTDTAEAKLTQAIELVDTGLSDLQSREIISASQVADMLLDLRLLLLDIDEGKPDGAIEAALTP
jgi:hypothetical protein